MVDLDPSEAATPDDLAACLRRLHLHADRPSLRDLETRTSQAGGSLPGTRIKRIPLRRATISEVLAGQTFPRKAFLLTFVEILGVDLASDRRWADAWDRLAQDQDSDAAAMSPGQLRQELAELRRQLAAAGQRPDARTRDDEAATCDSRAGDPGITRASRDRIRAFLQDMAGIAGSVTGDLRRKLQAQQDVARAAAGTDPDLAVDIARSITDQIYRDQALAGIARVVAATDPDLAVDIARSRSGNDNMRLWALLPGIACVVAAAEPDRAVDIVNLIGWNERHRASGELAPAVAPANPELGERMARSITDPAHRASALSYVARAVRAAHPDRAAQLADEAAGIVAYFPDSQKWSWLLRDVAQAVAATDPDRAVGLLKPIGNRPEMAEALTAVARAAAAAHPDRAEQIARSIAEESEKASALSEVARAAAAAHPDRAEQIAQSITENLYKSEALSGVAQALAAAHPGRAERIAWLATQEKDKAKALACVAHAAADTDPGQAAALTAYLAGTADQLACDGEIKNLAEFASAVAATHPALAEKQLAICLSAIGQTPDEDLRIEVLKLLCAVVESITSPAR